MFLVTEFVRTMEWREIDRTSNTPSLSSMTFSSFPLGYDFIHDRAIQCAFLFDIKGVHANFRRHRFLLTKYASDKIDWLWTSDQTKIPITWINKWLTWISIFTDYTYNCMSLVFASELKILKNLIEELNFPMLFWINEVF